MVLRYYSELIGMYHSVNTCCFAHIFDSYELTGTFI